MVIPCLIEHLSNVTDRSCRAFLRRMEGIVFSDYRLIHKFVEQCTNDINRLGCGRVERPEESDVSEGDL